MGRDREQTHTHTVTQQTTHSMLLSTLVTDMNWGDRYRKG